MAGPDSDGQKILANGNHEARPPIEIACRLPRTPGVEISLHLTTLTRTIMLFVTSVSAETGRQAAPPMGSFVYAIPDRYNRNEPMSTVLYSTSSTVDFATRMAKLLARKTQLPCYVGNSINLMDTPGGGSVEEEMEAFRTTVDAVMQQIEAQKHDTAAKPT